MQALLLTALFLALIPVQLQTAVVTGQLSSKDGTIVSGIRVSVTTVPEPGVPALAGATLVSSAMTDNAGRFRIENVPPGRYHVTAGLIQQPTYYPGVASVAGATAISVSAGATVAGINFDIVSPPGITVKGRVVFPTGVAAGNIRVSVNVSPPQPVPVAADGSFALARVRSGTYSLILTGVPADTQPQPATFTAAEQDIDGIEILLLRTLTVSGRVVVEGGGPRPGFGLSFASFKGGPTNLQAGLLPNSTFQVRLPEGDYRVSWNSLPAGYFVKSIAAGSTDLLANPLIVSSGSAPPQVVATLGVSSPPPWVKVSGRVDGAPRGSQLSLGAGTEGLIVAINADGSFEFPAILPGTYAARIIPALPVQLSPVFVPTKDVKGIQIVLPPMREISGRAVIEGGPQRALSMTFLVNNPGSSSVAMSAVAQADGTFKLSLPEGERRIGVNAPGFTVRSARYGATDLLKETIKVSLTGSEELRVTLAPGVPGGVVGGVVGGIGPGGAGGVLSPIVVASPPPPMIAPTELPREIARIVEDSVSPRGAPTPEPPATRVPESVLISSLVYRPQPEYPDDARRGRITGAVGLDVTVDRQGRVTDVRAVSGPAELRQAAIDAVKQWQYRPVTVNGAIVPVAGPVTVTFSLR